MRHSDFAELAAFAAIVEEGSFRGAAARLGLRPSTVSHSLRALEEKLGVQLLHRTTRSVAPTEAGQVFFARVGPALAGMESAVEAVNAHSTFIIPDDISMFFCHNFGALEIQK